MWEEDEVEVFATMAPEEEETAVAIVFDPVDVWKWAFGWWLLLLLLLWWWCELEWERGWGL